MGQKISFPATTFRKVLKGFDIGGLPYTEVQFHLTRLLATGASPEELLEVLRRSELIEPLPEYARVDVTRLLNDAIELAAAQNTELDDPEQDQISESDSAPILATDLAVARSALQSEHGKSWEIDRTLMQKIASDDAVRPRNEEALRDSEQYHTELRALRDSLAAREAIIAQMRASLSERDAQLTALQREHAHVVPALESRANVGSQLEADLQTSRAHAAALAADLAARDKTIAQMRHSLGEIDPQLSALQAEHAKIAAALETRVKGADAKLQAAQTRVAAITSELKASQDAAAALNARCERGEAELIAGRTELSAVQTQLNSYLELLQSRGWRRGFDQNRSRELQEQLGAAQAGCSALQKERDHLLVQVAGLQLKLKESDAWVDKQRMPASSDAQPPAAKLQSAVPRRMEESAAELAQFATRRAAPIASQAAPNASQAAPIAPRTALNASRTAPPMPQQPKHAIQIADFAPSARGGQWKPRVSARAIGAGAAILILAVVAWFFVHREPVKAIVPAVVTALSPKPGTVIRDCPTCPAVTVLPAGRFVQGSARADSASTAFERPLHWVAIALPFSMSTNAVTLDEFRAFIAATERSMQGCDTYDGEWKLRPENGWQNPGFVQTGSHPVTCVSWNDAKAYAGWLSKKTGHRYRLPSASEWEYAARAGGQAVQPWNPDGSGACASANVADQSAARRYPGWTVFGCDDGYINTAPVGSFKASAFGLDDMLGNVFQWTEDCWSADYTGAPIDGSARTDGDCAEHELRGGSWFSAPALVRANYRNHFAADYRTSSVGIRLVRDFTP
jgi:formylglycine-generating enzyme required for sulfatase activity/predicted  nucleic acid-binding Zn-ribbon protein